MTTLIYWKGSDFSLLASDSQVTAGNLKVKTKLSKIMPVGNNAVAGCGGVGALQRVLGMACKQIQISKIYSNSEIMDISLGELAGTLSELNFNLPLEYTHFNSFGFLVAGLDWKTMETKAYSIGDDGSCLELAEFYADGSGQQLALGKLAEHYNLNKTPEEAGNIIYHILNQISKEEIYTSGKPDIYLITKEGLSKFELELPEVKPQKENSEAKASS